MQTKCDCCGKSDIKVVGGIFGIIPFIFFYCCGVCIAMRAEPKELIEQAIKICDKIENIKKETPLIYYNEKDDNYINRRTNEPLFIRFKHGVVCNTREQAKQEI